MGGGEDVTGSPQQDPTPVGNGADEPRAAPDDWEFHLARVCARMPRTLSPRRLALLAALLDDEKDTPP
jgi:hypothetical protein